MSNRCTHYNTVRPQTVKERRIYPWSHSFRIRNVLNRLSRDKWLSPEEIRIIAPKLASKVSHNVAHTFKHAVSDGTLAVGLIRGKAAICPIDNPKKHINLQKALKNASKKQMQFPELIVIETLIKRDYMPWKLTNS